MKGIRGNDGRGERGEGSRASNATHQSSTSRQNFGIISIIQAGITKQTRDSEQYIVFQKLLVPENEVS